jgi:hypothetical protein
LRLPTLAQSFSPFLARDGRQVCRPAMNFSVTKMQEEKKIAQLVFLNKTNFLSISKTLAFWVWARKTCRPSHIWFCLKD